jgi:hypothetical protein
MGKAFAAAPLMLLPVAAYNILILSLAGGFASTTANARLTAPLFELRTAPGGVWPVSLADVLLAAALVVMFVELVKSTHDRRVAIVNHGLSITLFVGCLTEMLLTAAFATSTFFLITLMVLLDVLAGFMLAIAASRREPGLRPERTTRPD